MKKIFLSILAISLFAISGFSQNTSTLDDAKLTDFTKKLIKLPFKERDVILKANELFTKEFKGDPQTADWAYQILYYYHELSCDDKTITLQKTYADIEVRESVYKDIHDVQAKLKSEMKKFSKEYSKYGYRVKSYEDTSYAIEVNPAFTYNKLKKLLSKEYSYYRGLYVKEYDNVPFWHAELVVPIQEVMNRIAWRDAFLAANPDFIRHDIVTKEIEGLCFIVTKGLENSPIYDEKGVIKPEYKAAIQGYYRSYPETKWGLYLTDFMHRSALNKYRNSDAIDLFVIRTLFPEDRKNIDPILKYKDMLVENLMD